MDIIYFYGVHNMVAMAWARIIMAAEDVVILSSSSERQIILHLPATR
jgi:hypothetical protein